MEGNRWSKRQGTEITHPRRSLLHPMNHKVSRLCLHRCPRNSMHNLIIGMRRSWETDSTDTFGYSKATSPDYHVPVSRRNAFCCMTSKSPPSKNGFNSQCITTHVSHPGLKVSIVDPWSHVEHVQKASQWNGWEVGCLWLFPMNLGQSMGRMIDSKMASEARCSQMPYRKPSHLDSASRALGRPLWRTLVSC